MIVIGTAQGDLHDIGKNLVAMMLEGAGFKVVNLGRDVAPEKFVAAVEEHQAHIVGISALMTTTMPAMKRTIDALEQGGPPRAGEGDDRRRAGEPGVRRRDRRRRLRAGTPRSRW